MLITLRTIASSQATRSEDDMSKITDFLNYAATYPIATIHYFPNNMITHMHINASYLSESYARSHASGIFFLGNSSPNPTLPLKNAMLTNGVIHVLCEILTNIMSCAAEANIGFTFLTACDALHLRVALAEMGHPQPPTLI